MIRKQLYLKPSQDRALKRRAKELGVSEAELVRRALDDALQSEPKARIEQGGLLAKLFAEADNIAENYSFGAYHFNRQALAEEDSRHAKW